MGRTTARVEYHLTYQTELEDEPFTVVYADEPEARKGWKAMQEYNDIEWMRLERVELQCTLLERSDG
jgi:hypothetical protein